MLKNIIAPVQAWLLSQGKCVGCGASLSAGKRQPLSGGALGTLRVTCKCDRVYILDEATKRYRRARLDEV